MTKIDWGRPLRRVPMQTVSEEDQIWHYVGPSTETPGYHYCECADGGTRRFNGNGCSLTGERIQNIPPEPEHKEGWYEVDWAGGSASVCFWSGSDWFKDEDCDPDEALKSPFRVVSRHYLSCEYRPADTCPPPLTGEKFEVEGDYGPVWATWDCPGHGIRLIWVDKANATTHHGNWILKKRWRPIQDTQS